MATYENETAVKNVMVTTDVDDTVKTDETTTPDTTEKKKKEVKMVGQLPEGAHLDWAPIPFVCFGKTTRITSDELSSKIYKAFAESFHDLIGANVTCVNGNNFNLELFFEENTDACPTHKIKNLVNLTSPTGADSLYAKMQVVQNRMNNKNFTLNNETKMLLSEFMYGGPNDNHYNSKRWVQCIKQFPLPVSAYGDRYYRNGDRIIIVVGNLDLRKVLRKLYGEVMVTSTEDNGASHNNTTAVAYYQPRFVEMCANGNGTFIINIEQFDRGAVETFTAREHPQLIQNTGLIYYN